MYWRRQKSPYKLIETVFFFLVPRQYATSSPSRSPLSVSPLTTSKVKDFVLLPFFFLVEVASKTSARPGLPFQIKMPYLHNRTQRANIQHDFAINGCEKGLEMIFDLIEWHNWLDYTKFFPSLRNPQMLRRKQTNQTDWARSCACFCVCFYSLLVHAWMC